MMAFTTWMSSHRVLAVAGLVFLAAGFSAGCQPKESPYKQENESLRKQLAKQESVIQSLQDGNKVMQQQIDLLNRELREVQGKANVAEVETKKIASQLEDYAQKNKKLSGQLRWVKKKSTLTADSITIQDTGGQTRELLHPITAATKAVKEALSRNGYSLLASINTDSKAVFVTERKVSAPSSLEMAGFRNQYVLSLNTLPSKGTLLSVKADFEKTGQGGRVLGASKEEKTEIERRLISEISKKLAKPRSTKK